MTPFSLTVAKIEMLRRSSDDHVPGAEGTAFFYEYRNDLFLITNWHNVTGIDAVSGKVMHSQGLLPEVLRIHYKQQVGTAIRSQHTDLPLYVDGSPTWLEHSLRSGIDVVAIRLSLSDFSDIANKPINTVAQQKDLEPYAGMDCFILGFPEQLFGPALTPIWKRGSIASEPFDQRAYFYVDSATRKGMSGSPVIAKHTGIWGMRGGIMTGREIIGTVERFVGIYSGRVGNDSLGFQLGLVWKSSVLEDVLTANTPGKSPLR